MHFRWLVAVSALGFASGCPTTFELGSGSDVVTPMQGLASVEPAGDAGAYVPQVLVAGAVQGIDILDCPVDEGYEVNRLKGRAGTPEVHVLSVYETRRDHDLSSHPVGEATVWVTRHVPLILVLSSYEPTHWTVSAAPEAGIEQVILNGYSRQTVSAEAGIEVIDFSGISVTVPVWSACGYGDDGGGCDTEALTHGVEALTGQPVTSLVGCYRATQFVVAD